MLGSEMKHNLNTKNNSKLTTAKAAKVLWLATIILLVVGVTTITTLPLTALASRSGDEGFIDPTGDIIAQSLPRRAPNTSFGSLVSSQAPTVVTGDNIYIAWWTNNTENGNEEVMFRASTDGGATFSDRINLSNTTDADSWRVEIAGEGETVVVSWWETNQTSDIPVARISTDAGETFGPMIMLATNGTISTTEEEEENFI
jgi:hypothetical protein